MKQVVRLVTISALAVFVAAGCLGYAQKPQQENENKKQEQTNQPSARPQPQQPQQQQQRQQEQNRQQQNAVQQQQQRQQEQNRQQQNAVQQQQRRQQEQNRQQGVQQQMQRSRQQQREQQEQQERVWQQRRAGNFDSERRSWGQRGGYDGFRIPESFFRFSFGRSHSFRIYNLPFLYESGSPRFQYNGYWFSFMDPYPQYWGSRWYQTDDVYVDYRDDGYYLFNRRYPGRPGVAISISF